MAALRADVDLGVNTRGAKRSMQKAANELNKITGGMAGKEINFNVNGKSFTQPLGRITASANEFTKSLEASNARVIAFGASVGIINGITDSFKYLVTETIRFEKTLKDINVVLNASNAQLKQFGEGLFDVAQNTAQGFNIAADAALEFSRQGLSTEEVLKRTNDALTLTRITSLDAADAVSGLTAAVNAFGKTGLTTTDIIDKLAAVDVKFAVSSEDLINGLERAGAVAIDAGVSLDSLIGIITSLQQTTARGGAVIGNGLKTIFTRIQRPESIRQLEAMDLRVRDLTGAILPADTILKNIAKSFKDLTQAQQSNVVQFSAGIFQANIFRAALGDLAKAQGIQQQALGISANAAGEAARKNELLNKSISALASRAGTGIQELVGIMGELTVKDDIGGILDVFGKSIEGLKNALGGGEKEGNTFAKGLVRGIGNILTGPGMIAFVAIFSKLLLNVFKFAGGSLKDVLGIVSQKEKVKNVEEAIVRVLGSNKQITESLNNLEGDRLAQEKFILGVIEAQTNAMAQQQRLARVLAGPLVNAGIDESLSVTPNSGHYQDVNRDGIMQIGAAGVNPEAARREKKGAAEGGYAPGPIAKTKVAGVGDVVYNKAETIKQFPGMKQPAIMPPQKSRAGRNYGRAFGERHGFDPYASGGFVPNFFNQSTWGANDPRYKGPKGAQLSGTMLKLPPAKMMVETTKQDPNTNKKMVGWHYLEAAYRNIGNMKTIKESGLDAAFGGLNVTALGRAVYHSSEDLPNPKYPNKYQASGKAAGLQRAARRGTRRQRRNADNIAGSAYEGTLFDKSLKGQEYNETWKGEYDKDGNYIKGDGDKDANIDFFKMDHIPLEAKFGAYKDPNVMGKSIKLSSDSYIEDFLRANGQGGAAEAMMAIKRGASIEVLKKLGRGEDELEASGLSGGFVPSFATPKSPERQRIGNALKHVWDNQGLVLTNKAIEAMTGVNYKTHKSGAYKRAWTNDFASSHEPKITSAGYKFSAKPMSGVKDYTKTAQKRIDDFILQFEDPHHLEHLKFTDADLRDEFLKRPYPISATGASILSASGHTFSAIESDASRHLLNDIVDYRRRVLLPMSKSSYPGSGAAKSLPFSGLQILSKNRSLSLKAKGSEMGAIFPGITGGAPQSFLGLTTPGALTKKEKPLFDSSTYTSIAEEYGLADKFGKFLSYNELIDTPYKLNANGFEDAIVDISSHQKGFTPYMGATTAGAPLDFINKRLGEAKFGHTAHRDASDAHLTGKLLRHLIGSGSFSWPPGSSGPVNLGSFDFLNTDIKGVLPSSSFIGPPGPPSKRDSSQNVRNRQAHRNKKSASQGLIPNFANMDLYRPLLTSAIHPWSRLPSGFGYNERSGHFNAMELDALNDLSRDANESFSSYGGTSLYGPKGGLDKQFATEEAIKNHMGSSIRKSVSGSRMDPCLVARAKPMSFYAHTRLDSEMFRKMGGSINGPLASIDEDSFDMRNSKKYVQGGLPAWTTIRSGGHKGLDLQALIDNWNSFCDMTEGAGFSEHEKDQAATNVLSSGMDNILGRRGPNDLTHKLGAGGLIPNFARGVFDFDKMDKVFDKEKDKMVLPGKQRNYILDKIMTGNIPYDVVHGVPAAGKSTWAQANWPGAKNILSGKDFDSGNWTEFAVLAGQTPSRTSRKDQPKGFLQYSDQARALFAGARDIFAMTPGEEELTKRRQNRMQEAEEGRLPDSRSAKELAASAVRGRGDIVRPDYDLYDQLEDKGKDVWRMKALGLVPNFVRYDKSGGSTESWEAIPDNRVGRYGGSFTGVETEKMRNDGWAFKDGRWQFVGGGRAGVDYVEKEEREARRKLAEAQGVMRGGGKMIVDNKTGKMYHGTDHQRIAEVNNLYEDGGLPFHFLKTHMSNKNFDSRVDGGKGGFARKMFVNLREKTINAEVLSKLKEIAEENAMVLLRDDMHSSDREGDVLYDSRGVLGEAILSSGFIPNFITDLLKTKRSDSGLTREQFNNLPDDEKLLYLWSQKDKEIKSLAKKDEARITKDKKLSILNSDKNGIWAQLQNLRRGEKYTIPNFADNKDGYKLNPKAKNINKKYYKGAAQPVRLSYLEDMMYHDRRLPITDKNAVSSFGLPPGSSIPGDSYMDSEFMSRAGVKNLSDLGKHMKSSGGLESPVFIGYDSRQNKIQLSEGHHRVAAALGLNSRNIPALVRGEPLDSTGGEDRSLGVVNLSKTPNKIPKSVTEALKYSSGRAIGGTWSPSAFGIPNFATSELDEYARKELIGKKFMDLSRMVTGMNISGAIGPEERRFKQAIFGALAPTFPTPPSERGPGTGWNPLIKAENWANISAESRSKLAGYLTAAAGSGEKDPDKKLWKDMMGRRGAGGLVPNFAGIDVYRGMLGEKGKKYTKSDVFGVHPKRKNQFRSSSIYDIGGLKDYLLGHVDNQQGSSLVSTSTREGRAREFAISKDSSTQGYMSKENMSFRRIYNPRKVEKLIHHLMERKGWSEAKSVQWFLENAKNKKIGFHMKRWMDEGSALQDAYSFEDEVGLLGKDAFAKSDNLAIASRGVVPNFSNPLSNAIKREKAAGVPSGKIRVSQSNQLKGPANPMGLAVTNTRDEPAGIAQGIKRARERGIDPKRHGAAKGMVPNFASSGTGDIPKIEKINKFLEAFVKTGVDGIEEMRSDLEKLFPNLQGVKDWLKFFEKIKNVDPKSPESMSLGAEKIDKAIYHAEEDLKKLDSQVEGGTPLTKEAETWKNELEKVLPLLKDIRDGFETGSVIQETTKDKESLVKGGADFKRETDEILKSLEKKHKETTDPAEQKKIQKEHNAIVEERNNVLRKEKEIIEESTNAKAGDMAKLFFMSSMIQLVNGQFQELANSSSFLVSKIGETGEALGNIVQAQITAKELGGQVMESMGGSEESSFSMSNVWSREGRESSNEAFRNQEMERRRRNGPARGLGRILGPIGNVGRIFTRFIPIIGQVYTGFTIFNEALKVISGKSVFEHMAGGIKVAEMQIKELGKQSEAAATALESLNKKEETALKVSELLTKGDKRTVKEDRGLLKLRLDQLKHQKAYSDALSDLTNKTKVGEEGVEFFTSALKDFKTSGNGLREALERAQLNIETFMAQASLSKSYGESMNEVDTQKEADMISGLAGANMASVFSPLIASLGKNLADQNRISESIAARVDELSLNIGDWDGTMAIADEIDFSKIEGVDKQTASRLELALLNAFKSAEEEDDMDVEENDAYKELLREFSTGVRKGTMLDQEAIDIGESTGEFKKQLDRLIVINNAESEVRLKHVKHQKEINSINQAQILAQRVTLAEHNLISKGAKIRSEERNKFENLTTKVSGKRDKADNKMENDLRNFAGKNLEVDGLISSNSGSQFRKARQELIDNMRRAAHSIDIVGTTKEFNKHLTDDEKGRLMGGMRASDEATAKELLFKTVQKSVGKSKEELQGILNDLFIEIANLKGEAKNNVSLLVQLGLGMTNTIPTLGSHDSLKKMSDFFREKDKIYEETKKEFELEKKKIKNATTENLIKEKTILGAQELARRFAKGADLQRSITDNMLGEAKTLHLINKYTREKSDILRKEVGLMRVASLGRMLSAGTEALTSGANEATDKSVDMRVMGREGNLTEEEKARRSQLVEILAQQVATEGLESKQSLDALRNKQAMSGYMEQRAELVRNTFEKEKLELHDQMLNNHEKLKILKSSEERTELAKRTYLAEVLENKITNKLARAKEKMLDNANMRAYMASEENKAELREARSSRKMEETRFRMAANNGDLERLSKEELRSETIALEKQALMASIRNNQLENMKGIDRRQKKAQELLDVSNKISEMDNAARQASMSQGMLNKMVDADMQIEMAGQVFDARKAATRAKISGDPNDVLSFSEQLKELNRTTGKGSQAIDQLRIKMAEMSLSASNLGSDLVDIGIEGARSGMVQLFKDIGTGAEGATEAWKKFALGLAESILDRMMQQNVDKIISDLTYAFTGVDPEKEAQKFLRENNSELHLNTEALKKLEARLAGKIKPDREEGDIGKGKNETNKELKKYIEQIKAEAARTANLLIAGNQDMVAHWKRFYNNGINGFADMEGDMQAFREKFASALNEITSHDLDADPVIPNQRYGIPYDRSQTSALGFRFHSGLTNLPTGPGFTQGHTIRYDKQLSEKNVPGKLGAAYEGALLAAENKDPKDMVAAIEKIDSAIEQARILERELASSGKPLDPGTSASRGKMHITQQRNLQEEVDTKIPEWEGFIEDSKARENSFDLLKEIAYFKKQSKELKTIIKEGYRRSPGAPRANFNRNNKGEFERVPNGTGEYRKVKDGELSYMRERLRGSDNALQARLDEQQSERNRQRGWQEQLEALRHRVSKTNANHGPNERTHEAAYEIREVLVNLEGERDAESEKLKKAIFLLEGQKNELTGIIREARINKDTFVQSLEMFNTEAGEKLAHKKVDLGTIKYDQSQVPEEFKPEYDSGIKLLEQEIRDLEKAKKVFEESLTKIGNLGNTPEDMSLFQEIQDDVVDAGREVGILSDKIQELKDLLGGGFGGLFDSSGAAPSKQFLGGRIQKFAEGGFVTGPAGRDQVPAMLTAGEYVVPKDEAQKFAPGGKIRDALSELNNKDSDNRLVRGVQAVTRVGVMHETSRLMRDAMNKKQDKPPTFNMNKLDQLNLGSDVSMKRGDSRLSSKFLADDPVMEEYRGYLMDKAAYNVQKKNEKFKDKQSLAGAIIGAFTSFMTAEAVGVAKPYLKRAADWGKAKVENTVKGHMGFGKHSDAFKSGRAQDLDFDYKDISYNQKRDQYSINTMRQKRSFWTNKIQGGTQGNAWITQDGMWERDYYAEEDYKIRLREAHAREAQRKKDREITKRNRGGSIPAMLTAGEGFIPASTAKRIGYGNLNAMNKTGSLPIVQGRGGVDNVGPVGLSEGDFIIRKSSTDKLMKENPNMMRFALQNPDGFKRGETGYYEGGIVGTDGATSISQPGSTGSSSGQPVNRIQPLMDAAQAQQKEKVTHSQNNEVTNNINVNVTIDGSGNERVEAESTQGSYEQEQALAMKIKSSVLEVIREEKRLGGELDR